MGLITSLVSTVVHAAAGRNPYGRDHNQAPQPAADGHQQAAPHREDHAGCSAGPGGQSCRICAVALPFGRGRQAKFERRGMKHERKAVMHAIKAHRSQGRGQGAAAGYAAAGPYYRPQQQQQQQEYQQEYQQQYQRDVAYGGEQEEGVEEWHERRRASVGDAPPPAYEEGEASAAGARRRSVEVLGGDEKR